MNTYYCDGSTYKNGQVGQDSSIVVVKPDNTTHREHLGNFSINYAELFAIRRAAEFAQEGDKILSDSQIVLGWLRKQLNEKRKKSFFKSVANPIFTWSLLEITQDLVKQKNLVCEYVPRALNQAGVEIENAPFYPAWNE